ncbi:ammonia-dependent NAD(+) synthetase [Castellaniella sp.]|uniref:ammonia-dependent NAD(+) synthetase n=1 Tax=Castellaniella sp. TaxID=1955812 RepID=UPI00355E4D8F
MLSPAQQALQVQIRTSLGVVDAFDAPAEVARRVDFLVHCLQRTGAQGLVLGISGGVDSLVAGLLAQRAVQRVRALGRPAQFVAMRLPCGKQADEADAQAGLALIQPDETLVVDIEPAASALLGALTGAGLAFRDPARQDFIHGNIKARERMVAQYAVAGARGALVVGTDHAAEALMGFFTKYGDGAADVMPLAGLNKRRVRALGLAMGAPDALVFKVPTADLEALRPLKPDEEAFGVTYEQIDDFLEGREIPPEAWDTIIAAWRASAHKRAMPVSPLTLAHGAHH